MIWRFDSMKSTNRIPYLVVSKLDQEAQEEFHYFNDCLKAIVHDIILKSPLIATEFSACEAGDAVRH